MPLTPINQHQSLGYNVLPAVGKVLDTLFDLLGLQLFFSPPYLLNPNQYTLSIIIGSGIP